MNEVEIIYIHIESFCLSLFYACTELDYHLLSREALILCKTNNVRYLLNKIVLLSRSTNEWIIKLCVFSLKYAFP